MPQLYPEYPAAHVHAQEKEFKVPPFKQFKLHTPMHKIQF